MEAAKKMDDSTAIVCAELSNHEIFEKWRIVDTAGLTGERLAEYDRDRTESNRRYDEAFKVVLSHSLHPSPHKSTLMPVCAPVSGDRHVINWILLREHWRRSI